MLIGLLTGRVIGFGVTQKICWQCNVYKRKGLAPEKYPPHACKRSHVGSSASMETALAVKMQADLTSKGARLSVVVGDCDTHAISHLNAAAMPELRNVQKCHDLNHLSKNLKKSMSSLKDKYWKGNTKVLTPIMIGHLAHTFSRVVYRHRIDPRNDVLPLDAVDLLSKDVLTPDDISNTPTPCQHGIPNPADDVTGLIANQLNDNLLLPDDLGFDLSVFDYEPDLVKNSFDDVDVKKEILDLGKHAHSNIIIYSIYSSTDGNCPDLMPRNLFSAFEEVHVEVEDCRKEGFVFKQMRNAHNDATEFLRNTVDDALCDALDKGLLT